MPFVRALAVLAASLGLIAEPAAAAPWLTRIDRVANYSSQPIQVLDPSAKGLRLTVPAGESRDLVGQSIPVCADAKAFRGTAIQVRNARGGYLNALCQDARDQTVYMVRHGQFWLSRDKCADRAYAWVRVSVDAAGRLYCYGYDREPDPQPGTRLE